MNNIYDQFVSKWSTASTSSPERGPESSESLQRIEKSLAVTLPKAYVDFMLSVGEVWTPDILDCIVDQEVEMPDIQNMLSFEQAERTTRAWQEITLPENMFAFATDCMGNMFCFDTNSCVAARCDDLPVFLCDHELGTTEVVADSFVTLLAKYVELEEQ
jgi:SMI1/KNR4 family protein SUKH-1